jgi:hypothetical protein
MMRHRMLNLSEPWFGLLQRLYPPAFRDEWPMRRSRRTWIALATR